MDNKPVGIVENKRIICPSCGAKYKLPENRTLNYPVNIKCKKCSARFVVNAPGDSSTQKSAEEKKVKKQVPPTETSTSATTASIPTEKCSKCNATNKAGDQFCGICGYSLIKQDETEANTAGVIVNNLEKLKTILEDIKAQDLYIGDHIPHKKLTNAITHFPISQDVKVVALLDCTVMGSNKNGLAITNNGIIWKNDWATDSVKTTLSWAELSKVKNTIELSGSKIAFEKNVRLDIAGSNIKKEDAFYLFKSLAEFASSAPDDIVDDLNLSAPSGFCSMCNAPNKAGDKFCGICGYDLVKQDNTESSITVSLKICPKCGAPNEIDHTFCDTCGVTISKSECDTVVHTFGRISERTRSNNEEREIDRFLCFFESDGYDCGEYYDTETLNVRLRTYDCSHPDKPNIDVSRSSPHLMQLSWGIRVEERGANIQRSQILEAINELSQTGPLTANTFILKHTDTIRSLITFPASFDPKQEIEQTIARFVNSYEYLMALLEEQQAGKES